MSYVCEQNPDGCKACIKDPSTDKLACMDGMFEEIPIHTASPQPLPIYTTRPVPVNFEHGALVIAADAIEFSRIHEIVDRFVCRPEALAKAYNWVLDGIEDEEQDAAGTAIAGVLLAVLNDLEQQGIEVRL